MPTGECHALPPHELVALLSAEHIAERLVRLEQSLTRLERINSATLTLMQQYFRVNAPTTNLQSANENADA